ncbi:MAG TPA: peptidase [Mycobacteriales bacterium]|nr:peptidase [Mycobacteriales bacterium]
MLSRRVTALAISAAAGLGGLIAPHASATPGGENGASHQGAAISSPGRVNRPPARVPGLPAGVPRAALLAEPRLPEPAHAVWPFPSAFSRTSGTGRLDDGAMLWTDWVYDDHGAAAPTGAPLSTGSATISMLAPSQGLASYSNAAAHGNGADIFRAAVGLTPKASYWRVDWNTLADPDVPVAEWTFDTDNDVASGATDWPAGAGVRSPGIDRSLVVSAKAVQLIDGAGHPTDVLSHGGSLTVDRASRSFVVRVPRSLLPVAGTWRIRLASGVASSDGRSFAPADYSGGADAQQADHLPRVYNVTFRGLRQEPPVYRDGLTDSQVAALQAFVAANPTDAILGVDGVARAVTGNFWMEDHQADALARGNVQPFYRDLTWSQLGHRRYTPQPHPRGYSNRWYVSRLNLGQGVVANAGTVSPGDLRPNYLSRVQPYAVYVPHHMSLRKPHPLTWVLHSLGVNLNQYGALDPRLLRAECEDRRSICATTEGFAPDGWYFDEAEVDFWSVWHALATSYRLDSRRTVMSGYSMGGWASYKLTLEHPDLFSQAMPLEGPPNCGIRIIELNGRQVAIPASAQGGGANGDHCGSDGYTTPLLGNAKWVPYVVTQGGIDELVPFPSDVQATNDMRALGDRYTFFLLPADDHLLYALQDRFGGIVHALGAQIPKVKRDPGSIVYRWFPDLDSASLGIGTTTAYWITHLTASTHAPGAIASVRARSYGIRQRSITAVRHAPQVVANPLPAVRTQLTWRRGRWSRAADRLTLWVANVRALTVDAARARLSCPAVTVITDRPVRVTLTHLRGETRGERITRRVPAGRLHLRAVC